MRKPDSTPAISADAADGRAHRGRWAVPVGAVAIFAVVLVVLAALLWRFPAVSVAQSHPTATGTQPAIGRDLPAVTVPAPRAHTASRAAAAAIALPPATTAILRGASRDELLAYGRDLLANGGPPENVVALLEFLVNDRPELAIDVARATGRTDGEHQVFLFATLSAWADKDAPAALRWAFRNSDAYGIPGQTSLLYIVLQHIAADDPSAAVAATEAFVRSDAKAGDPPPDVARFTLEALIKAGHGDLAQKALAQWSAGPEATHLHGADFEIVALSLARDGDEPAGRWLQSLPSSPARNAAFLPVAAQWAQQDAAAAMTWAATLQPADGGDEVRIAVFARWLQSDRGAAMEWLRNHSSPEPTRLLRLVNPPAVADQSVD